MSKNIGIFIHPESGNVGIGTSQPRAQLEVFGSIVPSSNLEYDLGSSSLRWRELYLSGNSINLGGTTISRDATTGGIKFVDPNTNQPLDSTVRNLTASNLTVLGDYVTLNTITSNTEQMVITNAGTGPALKVTQTGANTIAEFFDDGNVLALKIADGGNVGIGTGIPIGKLHVYTDKGPALLINQLGYSNIAEFSALGLTRATIDGNGMVGIGTNTPLAHVHVRGDNTSSGGTYVRIDNNASRIQLVARDTNPYIGTISNQPFHIATNNSFKVSVLENGNVGIGTTNPESMLHVSGGISCGPRATVSILTQPGQMTLTNASSTYSNPEVNNSVPSIYIYNTNSTSATANALLILRTGGPSGGSPFVSFDITGEAGWAVGMYNPDNTFRISNSWASLAGTGVYLTQGGTSWTGLSDERVKDIFENIENGLQKVCSLRSVIGKFLDDDTSIRRPFLIAQDVDSVFPEAVDKTNSNKWGLRYSDIIPLLVSAIKDINNKLEDISSDIETLKKSRVASY